MKVKLAMYNSQPDSGGPGTRLVTLFLSAVIGIAAIGYFVGLADGVPRPDRMWQERPEAQHRPPIIPHAIQNTNDAACYACHSNGVQMAGLKASVMSHGFLANCTQCHAAPPPPPFQDVDAEVATDFVGLPAPLAGHRAYPGAPPTIPHSRWMRDKCTACHGGPNGWAGMESTHPWRTNCTQCHAPSAVLDQAIAADPIPMLPPITLPAS